ncbi:RVP_2 domain-containing protein [Cephalotus follicularis]|uniref:RVP_2 domain-containing protein n=1 Tax=Cephalotus follicularis TaxID=3775 RepID=A0A1Q3BAS1_CEPFO|nr:RVP_2 domain-containing protein [Cephalotus follicularis]
MAGQHSPKSIRITGVYLEHKLHVLIDNGSTHNFIQERIAQKLNMAVVPCKPFKVLVGNGEAIYCTKQCKGIKLQLQDIDFVYDLYVLPFKGSDIVLGFEWLETLGPILTYYKKLSMKFDWQGKSLELLGESIKHSQPLQLQHLRRLSSCGSIASMFYLKAVQVEGSVQQTIPEMSEGIQQLLSEFHQVFDEPKQLPPSRENDHRIHLISGSTAVNVKP